ncbi:unnamed protein product [Clonostachys rosea]|uniref:Uncharacterized protein n=1 Tax=Bionectria ochroleuca TaxID=29856 RepID=A0ABY6TUS1_BIOOC|nr:unnamed protein product [Clonostachys rosea]
MSRNLTVIKELGLWCPYGGNPYICEGAYYEFVGCCKHDPCANNGGYCEAGNTTTANSTLIERGIYLPFICRNTDYAAELTNTWPYHVVGLPNGKNLSCVGSTDTGFTDARCLPPDRELREQIMSLGSPNGTNITEEFKPTPSLDSGIINASQPRSGQTWSPLLKDDIVGLSIGITVFTLVLLGLLGRYFWMSESKKYAFSKKQSRMYENSHQNPLKAGLRKQTKLEHWSSINVETSTPASLHQESSTWYGDRQRLDQKNFAWYAELIWDVILTIAPAFFIVVPVLALCINDQPLSSHGETLMSINRLIPTIYPILFAAVAARFYKNLGRWHLEQPDGISLAALEQIMGSQSFAGALERLLFVRTQVPIGILILVIWVMSPLGGQGGARMVNHAHNEYLSNGNVFYVHPSYQVSSYSSQEYEITMRLGINTLYSSSLLSSPDQKLAPRDLWEMPKIPQRDKSKPRGEMYEIDKEALSRGDNEYYSLIGTKIQGLDFAKQSNAVLNFTVETSFIEYDCICRYPDFTLEAWLSHPQYDPLYSTFGKLRNELNDTSLQVQFSGGIGWTKNDTSWADTQRETMPHLGWLSARGTSNTSYRSDGNWKAKIGQILFNCSMDTVTLETEMLCDLNSTNPTCSAERQRLVDIAELKLDLLRRTMKSVRAMWNLIQWWRTADGGFNNRASSPTEVYISGSSSPYGSDDMLTWTSWDEKQITRRMTSAFNTFHMVTLNPMNHTEISFRKDPGPQKYLQLSPSTPTYYNTTIGVVTTTVEVYRVDKAWVALHLATSFVLLILAGLGLGLRFLIKGPDVIGYASSMTRDNAYIPLLQDSGSVLHGPTRARLLKDIRVQLADVRPESDAGYIAFRAVPANLQKGVETKDNEQQHDLWRPFADDRRYV